MKIKSVLTKDQNKIIEKDWNYLCLRYDDKCGNGRNMFSITIRSAHGYGHDVKTIKEIFPEYAYLLKWHGAFSDKPCHIENALYHASNRDCWGLEKGEIRQLRSGNGLLIWTGAVKKGDGTYHELFNMTKASDRKPENDGNIEYIPWNRIGEGKERDLEAAREAAVWSNARVKDFTREKLEARIPKLQKEFKKDMESIGFIF